MKRRFGPAFNLAAAAIVVVVLLGATVATGYAAQGALPGSPLHSVKTGLERARLALSLSEAEDARLQLRFAEVRLEELAGLIEAGRFDELEEVAAAFEAHIQAAIRGLAEIAQSNPAEAQDLAGAVTEALSRYATLLTDLAAAVPSNLQTPLLHALEAANEGAGADENENANENDNDDLNENDNENDNLNTNDNENDNDDLNENENENENENANDNENDNLNANDNENENQNQNDNENQNENMNENQNDNQNDNDNENVNENDN